MVRSSLRASDALKMRLLLFLFHILILPDAVWAVFSEDILFFNLPFLFSNHFGAACFWSMRYKNKMFGSISR